MTFSICRLNPILIKNRMIKLANLTVKKKNKYILNNINLQIQPGEKILLQGESGSGKSTLIKSILFFEEFTGKIYYKGNQVNENNLAEFRKKIVYIGQILPNFSSTVREFLQLPFEYKANQKKRLNRTKMKKLLIALNFNVSILEEKFSNLSGGEKQRCVLLQVLLLDKDIYFFDEITSALDQKNIIKAISLITKSAQKTIISISHNQEWEKYCNRKLELKKGKTINDLVS